MARSGQLDSVLSRAVRDYLAERYPGIEMDCMSAVFEFDGKGNQVLTLRLVVPFAKAEVT